MQGMGEALASNYSSGAPADQGAVTWKGGRGQLVITATTYPTTTVLRFKARSGVDIDVITVAGNGIYPFDAPAGQYYLHMAAGVAAALYADLVAVRYG